jgi:hypothetical protein
MNDHLPLSLIARFSSDGRLYQAFGYYIAAGHGYVLLVPVGVGYDDGVFAVTQGSPVPVEEISALINEPLYRQHELGPGHPLWALFAALCDTGWYYDLVPIMPGASRVVLRAVNQNGIRYAEVVPRTKLAGEIAELRGAIGRSDHPNDRSGPDDTKVPWP